MWVPETRKTCASAPGAALLSAGVKNAASKACSAFDGAAAGQIASAQRVPRERRCLGATRRDSRGAVERAGRKLARDEAGRPSRGAAERAAATRLGERGTTAAPSALRSSACPTRSSQRAESDAHARARSSRERCAPRERHAAQAARLGPGSSPRRPARPRRPPGSDCCTRRTRLARRVERQALHHGACAGHDDEGRWASSAIGSHDLRRFPPSTCGVRPTSSKVLPASRRQSRTYALPSGVVRR